MNRFKINPLNANNTMNYHENQHSNKNDKITWQLNPHNKYISDFMANNKK